MFDRFRTLRSYDFHGLDGDIGSVSDILFDDHDWTVRYLVADTGSWLKERQVLIAPNALTAADRDANHIVVNLTKAQIEGSPLLDTDKPVSRQFETAYFGYYNWPMYWGGPHYTPRQVPDPALGEEALPGDSDWDTSLRSADEVTGYRVQTVDGQVGQVHDFILDDETWAIRYLVVETGSWWSGKKVLIAPKWIARISWPESRVFVSLTQRSIKGSPEYTDESVLTRDYEAQLHRHYNRRGYWTDQAVVTK